MEEHRLTRSTKKPTTKEYYGKLPNNEKNQTEPNKPTNYTTTIKCNQSKPSINKPIFRLSPKNVPPLSIAKRMEKDLEAPIECKFHLDCHFLGKECKNGSHEKDIEKMNEFFSQPKEILTDIFKTAMQAKKDRVPPCIFKASCWFAFDEHPKCKNQHYDSLKELELKYYKILSAKPINKVVLGTKNIVKEKPIKNKENPAKDNDKPAKDNEKPAKNNENPAKNNENPAKDNKNIPEDIMKLHWKTKMQKKNKDESTKTVYYEDPYGKTYALNKATNELYIIEDEIKKRVDIYCIDGEEYGKDVDGTIYQIENAEQQEQLVKYCIQMS